MLRLLLITSTLLLSGAVFAGTTDVNKPKQLNFGSSVKDTMNKLKPFCSSLSSRSITPITAPLATNSQVQVDCSGFLYAGKERNIEVVFQDDQLDIIWILFPKVEKNNFISDFTSTFGEATMEIDYGVLFLQANAAIRNEPSEVLFASDRQVKVMMKALQTKK